MPTRLVLSSALMLAVAVGSVGSGAQAAAKTKKPPPPPPPLCKLVVSPLGNTPQGATVVAPAYNALHTTNAAYDPALDLISADIASNATTITVVFRLAKLGAPNSAAMSPTGRLYMFNWVWASNGSGNSISARIMAPGSLPGLSDAYSPSGTKAVVDVAHGEIRLSAPIDSLPGHPLVPPGEKMKDMVVVTDTAAPGPYVIGLNTTLGETVFGTKSYPHRAPSCVKVGA